MKKYIVIMLITLVGLSTTSKAQKGQSLLPTKNGGAFYSKTELENYIFSHADYKKEFLAVINEALANAGENIVVTENNVEWILDHIEFSQKTLGSFRNSYRIGNLIYFFDDANYTGIIGTFIYGKCHENVIKGDCGNFLKRRISPNIKNQTAPVAGGNQNNTTTVYVTTAPAYQQPKRTTFTYQHDKTVKAGWNVGVSGGGMQQCIGSAINGDYLGAAAAGFGSISIGKTPASEEHIFYTGEATGQDVGFPNINQNNSYSNNNNYGGYAAVNGFYPNGRPTWR